MNDVKSSFVRERLFRAIDSKTKNWVCGGISKIVDRSEYYIISHTKLVTWDVEQDTIGDFIGLFDVTGQKIFEGDILKYGNNIGIVFYYQGCYCVKDIRKNTYPAIDVIFNEYIDIRVIGNIWDNPYLLEQGQ